jgi:3,4-dihydroxy-9,10-secoandrosta-1,3,5(10)-triene-9,17-dione 4,5-dioxygenase
MGSGVASLGYIVVTAEDLGAWRKFAEDVLGLAVAPAMEPAPDQETLLLRMDDRSWRLGIEQGKNGGVAALGFEVRDRAALEEIQGLLERAGIATKLAPEVAAHRQVLGVLQASDPAGVPLEFFYGAKIDQSVFVSPRAVQFKTGEQGVGHLVLMTGDADEAYNFYVNLLGFRVSDLIAMATPQMKLALTFTSPNPRHHSVAFAGIPGMKAGIQHIMLEVDSLDAVGRGLDLAMDNGVPIQSGLGKHTNDHMVSFYMISPSGLPIEYGWGGRAIDNRVHMTGNYDAASYWGHRPPAGSPPPQMPTE